MRPARCRRTRRMQRGCSCRGCARCWKGVGMGHACAFAGAARGAVPTRRQTTARRRWRSGSTQPAQPVANEATLQLVAPLQLDVSQLPESAAVPSVSSLAESVRPEGGRQPEFELQPLAIVPPWDHPPYCWCLREVRGWVRAQRVAQCCTSAEGMQAVRGRIAAAARASSARSSDIALRWQRCVLQALCKLQCLAGKLAYAHIRTVLSDR